MESEKEKNGRDKVALRQGGIQKEEIRPGQSDASIRGNQKNRKSAHLNWCFNIVESHKEKIVWLKVALRHGGIPRRENRPGQNEPRHGQSTKGKKGCQFIRESVTLMKY
ncbi:hypothetical protein BSG1_15885 [Bacillus sp. SG-1]|nr:hypothetical protein BSG1_15885 [Bacillus sp. SG-1]